MAGSACWTSRRPEGRRAGFTLIEVLIAFVILGLVSVAIYRALSSGIGGIEAAEARTIALLHARSKLDEVGSVIPIETGELDGTFEDGLSWTVSMTPFIGGQDTLEAELPLAAYQVQVSVRDRSGQTVTLSTYRLTGAL